MCGTAAAGCRQMVKRQGMSPLVTAHKEGAQISCKQPTGVGSSAAMAAGFITASGGKKLEEETEGRRKSIYGISPAMQRGCQGVEMPAGEEWMWFNFIRHLGICCRKED